VHADNRARAVAQPSARRVRLDRMFRRTAVRATAFGVMAFGVVFGVVFRGLVTIVLTTRRPQWFPFCQEFSWIEQVFV